MLCLDGQQDYRRSLAGLLDLAGLLTCLPCLLASVLVCLLAGSLALSSISFHTVG